MTNAEAAMQYLIWALEEMEKSGNQEAARHARTALEALQGVQPGSVTGLTSTLPR
jgi:hypothetical protein